MKLKEALYQARSILNDNQIDDSSLEAEVFLRHVLHIDRVQLFAEPDIELDPLQEQEFFKFIERRCHGEPSAYITGHREFYGLDFIVNPDVLIPRPETELLVEKALEFAENHKISSIADIGTGCGAIAISIAKKLSDVIIHALDNSENALKTAQDNCNKHKVSEIVQLRKSDLLESLPEQVDILIANLPYVRSIEIPQSGPLSFEPSSALDGGKTGLEHIEILCRQSAGKINQGGCMLLEIGQGQAESANKMISEIYPKAKVEIFPDYAGIERIVGVYLT